MARTYTIPLSTEYTIESYEEMVDIFDAESILVSKRQRKYTSASRQGFIVTLRKDIWTCPYCSAHVPAYPQYFEKDISWRKISANEIHAWASPQMTLFKTPYKPLYFNQALHRKSVKCPYCGMESSTSAGMKGKARNAYVVRDKKRLKVSVEIHDITEIFSLDWISKLYLEINLPLYETLTFNFSKGKVFLTLSDSMGKSIAVTDITFHPEKWQSGSLYDAINTYKLLQRTMKREFAVCYGATLPFGKEELDIKNLILMTRYHGDYSASFYKAIPLSKNSLKVDASFRSVDRHMHSIGEAVSLYSSSPLPQSKTIRKIFFENPGLLFYVSECRLIWDVLKDINLFRTLLTSNMVYYLLSIVHTYPHMNEYYSDCVAIIGSNRFLRSIFANPVSINTAAIAYHSLNEVEKASIRHKLKQGRKSADHNAPMLYCDSVFPFSPSYSVPMQIPIERIKPCTINGYRFVWLINSSDYVYASSQLQNCLDDWKPWNDPVIAVWHSGKIVAAIQINPRTNTIMQALGHNNTEIDTDSNLGKAFAVWKRRYGLEMYDEHDLPDLDEEDY